jgi:CRISPR-associated endonuclease/helicase Cas3
MLMRDYALDLQARWPAAASGKSDLLLELLAFAEGRFLTVHPFRDFNGRIVGVGIENGVATQTRKIA